MLASGAGLVLMYRVSYNDPGFVVGEGKAAGGKGVAPRGAGTAGRPCQMLLATSSNAL